MFLENMKRSIITVITISTVTLGGLLYTCNDPGANEEKKQTIYICYCAGGCICNYETLKPGGRCVCGLATIPSDKEELSNDYIYECDCGTMCDCGSRADEPGLCHCGILEMREVE